MVFNITLGTRGFIGATPEFLDALEWAGFTRKSGGDDIHIVFFYDDDETGGHKCDRAVFDVLLNGNVVGQINLNNDDDPPPGVSSGGSVYGGEFHAKNVNDHIKIELQCARSSCHTTITTFMMIVKGRNGKYAVLDNCEITDIWWYDLSTLDYIYKFRKFSMQRRKGLYQQTTLTPTDPVRITARSNVGNTSRNVAVQLRRLEGKNAIITDP